MIAPLAPNRPPIRLALVCYQSLRLAGWLAVTLACVAALWLLFFMALGNFSFGGTVLQLENFTSRYIAASAERQDRFARLFWLTSAGLFAAVSFFRRHALLTRGEPAAANPRETNHG